MLKKYFVNSFHDFLFPTLDGETLLKRKYTYGKHLLLCLVNCFMTIRDLLDQNNNKNGVLSLTDPNFSSLAFVVFCRLNQHK